VFHDFDQDGRVDLWVSDSKYDRLLRSVGPLRFQDVTAAAGIAQLSGQYVSWGTGAHDFDNDGRDDLFIVHGGLIHMVPQEHSVFRNLGDGKFEEVSTAAGAFFAQKSVGRGAAFADYDNDGRAARAIATALEHEWRYRLPASGRCTSASLVRAICRRTTRGFISGWEQPSRRSALRSSGRAGYGKSSKTYRRTES
jgi:hypothetical protein